MGESESGTGRPDEAGMVTYLVRVRAEVARRIQAAAAREGASPEAVAALWLEEHAEEVPRTHRAGPTPPDPP